MSRANQGIWNLDRIPCIHRLFTQTRVHISLCSESEVFRVIALACGKPFKLKFNSSIRSAGERPNYCTYKIWPHWRVQHWCCVSNLRIFKLQYHSGLKWDAETGMASARTMGTHVEWILSMLKARGHCHICPAMSCKNPTSLWNCGIGAVAWPPLAGNVKVLQSKHAFIFVHKLIQCWIHVHTSFTSIKLLMRSKAAAPSSFKFLVRVIENMKTKQNKTNRAVSCFNLFHIFAGPCPIVLPEHANALPVAPSITRVD
jgi:hypothetical protein